MSPNEELLYRKLMDSYQEKSKWVSLVYLLVTKYGNKIECINEDGSVELTGFKLVVEKVSEIAVPALDNPLEWEYNPDDDSVRFEISEDKTTKIIVPENKIL